MGFLTKSAFWLGLVYSAMPLDFKTLTVSAPATAVAPLAGTRLTDARPQTADASRAADEVAAVRPRARLRLPSNDSPARSIDTLAAKDRAAPWRAPLAPG